MRSEAAQLFPAHLEHGVFHLKTRLSVEVQQPIHSSTDILGALFSVPAGEAIPVLRVQQGLQPEAGPG